MKYFCKNNERVGGAYYEFRRGDECLEEPWLDSSMYIYDEVAGEIGLFTAIEENVPDFAPYGITVVTKEQWENIETFQNGNEFTTAIKDIAIWIENNFKENDFFVLMGI